MKNLIIAILGTKIIIDLPIWELGNDAVVVCLSIFIVIWVSIEGLDQFFCDVKRKRKIRNRGYEKFCKEITDLTERKKENA